MVTTDSLTQYKYNVVYWDKTPFISAGLGMDSFIIYRETSTNVYSRIGAVSKDSLRRCVISGRILKRSMTTSMVCFDLASKRGA